MPARASKVSRRLLAASLAFTTIYPFVTAPARAEEPPLVTTDDSQDSFYCQERRLGYWFYCTRPKPPQRDNAQAPPATSATS
ncbi:MAG TPA: conjugal transfer protein TraF, partial [Novosphingobium sp.]|nr:conjugal transfer protein TraF [Novosphingobium sp.]